MNSENFLASLETLTTAPDGVNKLRELIFELAIRGKLVQQVPTDEPASKLLESIAADKHAHSKSWKKPAVQEDANTDGFSRFTIPASWSWCSLIDVIEPGQPISYGVLVPGPSVENGIPFIRVQDLSVRNAPLIPSKHIAPEIESKYSRTRIVGGELLLGVVGSIGKVGIAPKEWSGANIARAVCRIMPHHLVDSNFLAILLQSGFMQRYFKETTRTLAQPTLNVAMIRSAPVPLPPITEQRHIVAKADQLMTLCDELDAKQAQKQEVGARLTRSALNALTSAEGPEEFAAAWRRVADNFDVLLDRSGNIGALRDAILALAVQGKLEHPHPKDEPVETLLNRIETERKKHLGSGKFRRGEAAPSIDDDEIAESPPHWRWERLGQLADVVGGVTKGRELRERTVASYPYLRVANVQRGFLDLNVMKEIELPTDELERYRLRRGDVLFTEGGDWDQLGRSAVWEGAIDPCLHQNHVFRARTYTDDLNPRWISLFANSPVGRRYFEEAAKQTTNLASINMTQLRHCPMPVPPAQEQVRILKRIDHFMALCNELETKLRDAEKGAERLAEAMTAAMVT